MSVDSNHTSKLVEIINYDVGGYFTERFHLSPKRKFDIFFYSLLIIAFLLDSYFIRSTYVFFSYTMIFGITLLLNDKKFYDISVSLWEFLIGVFIIVSSFTLVTPVKWYFVPGTRVFGVFNGGVLIVGYFVIYYGLKRYKTVLPFLLFYGILVTVNGTKGILIGDFAEQYISPVSSGLAYGLLNWLGYPVSISGTTITIITQDGTPISATVAGACSGIQGMSLATIMLVGLFIGSKIKYLMRSFFVVVAVIIVFFINVVRLTLIFISGYYWGHEGFELGHSWYGTLFFLAFILSYWYLIDKMFSRLVENDG